MDKQAVYMSFVNGNGFAGACIVLVERGEDTNAMGRLAIQESHNQKCNPGGEVLMLMVSDEIRDATDQTLFNRLMNRAEVEAWDNAMCAIAPTDAAQG